MKLHWPDEISVNRFMDEFWQKKPLLFKNAFPELTDFVTPDELAGLACEEDIESRLVMEKSAQNSWQVEHGPFEEDYFATLPESRWTLLVQDVDKHIPVADELIAQFNFLPKWRIDDLMISYAADQGSVGPHTDSYDVFLIQLQGERLWKLSDRHYSSSDLIDDCDIRVIKDYQTSEEYLLKPGDMLYLPPDVAHWGIAQGECMTGSVGFISPRLDEIFNSWADFVAEKLPAGIRYRDPELQVSQTPCRIDTEAISKITGMLKKIINTEPSTMTRWFGQMISEVKPHLDIEEKPGQELTVNDFLQLQSGTAFFRHPYLRVFYAETDSQLLLFLNGKTIELPVRALAFADLICENSEYPQECFSDWLDDMDCLQCLVTLVNHGYIVPHDWR